MDGSGSFYTPETIASRETKHPKQFSSWRDAGLFSGNANYYCIQFELIALGRKDTSETELLASRECLQTLICFISRIVSNFFSTLEVC
jgi:hypothetical protein